MGSATGGLFYWGIMSVYSMTACGIRHKMAAARFILLSALFTLGIVSLFMIDTPRADGVIYGRYSEILLPILIGTGLTAMVHSPGLWKGSFGIICFQSVMMYLVNWKISSSGAYGIYRHSIPAVAYALEFSSNRVFAFTKNVYLGGVFFGLTMAGVLWIVRRRERFLYLAFVWAVIQWGLGMDVCSRMNYKYNRDNYQDIIIAEQIKDMAGEYERIVFLYSDGYGYVDLLQFCLKEIPVHVLKEQYGSIRAVTQQDIVVTSRWDIFSKELGQTYGMKRESAHFEEMCIRDSQSRGSSEKFHGAVIDHYGKDDTRVYREVTAVGSSLEQLSEITGSVTKAKVAVIFDWENRWRWKMHRDREIPDYTTKRL